MKFSFQKIDEMTIGAPAEMGDFAHALLQYADAMDEEHKEEPGTVAARLEEYKEAVKVAHKTLMNQFY